jgi:hypothetical protein
MAALVAAALVLDLDLVLDLQAELAVGLEVVPLASGNIADVDRQGCFPDRLAEESGVAAEKQSFELVIPPQPEDKAGTAAVEQEDAMVIVSPPETEIGSTVQRRVIVWMMPAGSSVKFGAEALVEPCLVAAAEPEVHDCDAIDANEVYHTKREIAEQVLGIEKMEGVEEAGGDGTSNYTQVG